MRGAKSIETGTLMRQVVVPLPAMEAYKGRSQPPMLVASLYTSGARGLERPGLRKPTEATALHLPRAPGLLSQLIVPVACWLAHQ